MAIATIQTRPGTIQQGGRVVLVATPANAGATILEAQWEVVGVGPVDGQAVATDGSTATATWLVPSDQQPGLYQAHVTLTINDADPDEGEADVEVLARPLGSGDPVSVTMRRTETPVTDDQAFWVAIRNSTNALSFNRYAQWIEPIMCGNLTAPEQTVFTELEQLRSVPFPDVDQYRKLKVATELFVMFNCGVRVDAQDISSPFDSPKVHLDVDEERLRLGRPGSNGADEFTHQIELLWRDYITDRGQGNRVPGEELLALLPYLAVIRLKLGDVDLVDGNKFGQRCYGILRDKMTNPCLLELIWSYWHEEGMLVQSANAISLRFQNILGTRSPDPLAHLETDPLRPLNNLIWGFVQDEQHRLTVARRAYEYDHHYGLTLLGKAVPGLRPADSRSRFLEAFHNLLNLAAIFYKEDDDTTVIADGFPLLNALKEVHLLLTEGQHNQYGDLPWQARQEMLMQQWLLARPEVREFLPGRVMVAYPERWMDPVDSMKRLQGWTDTSIMHFRDLGVFGEQVLLSIRYGNWNRVILMEQAANWARYWRPEIQGYIHAYRAVTGVDLTSEPVDSVMPAIHLRRRLAEQLQGRVRGPAALDGRATRARAAVGRRRAPAQLEGGQQPVGLPVMPAQPRAQIPARGDNQ